MSYHFYAMLSRMKNIYRWGLMRNTKQESLSEHTLETAFVAHALSLIHNNRFGGNVDADRMAVLALFHDTSEIITGDMPTPIKYYNPEIKKVYKEIEKVAEDKLLSMLPDYLSDDLAKVYSDIDDTARLIIKAADKISAYIKCIEELKMGNQEFLTAKASTEEAIKALNFPAADVFLEDFIPSFMLSLDEQN
ncbi:MAG: 5'-deoxynucleotidase [Clostridia bacterium]|nr:5'-deoxynucleotidase [Oscillospiraceae bacterium]MBQ2746766.1 5'-deoxynucleotidase [Clostridia bacterium]